MTDDRRAAAEERRLRWLVRLGGALISALAHTWRIRVVNAGPWERMHARREPCILTFWHGEILPSAWFFRKHAMTTMISEHRDGELIARLVARWGIQAIRGSSSRGAGRALLQMIRVVEEGKAFAFTPDGPRGPAGVPQSGALLASQRARAPIVPVRFAASRAWRMRSWDRFMIPKPFATVTVTFGDPWLATGTDGAARTEFARRMGPALP